MASFIKVFLLLAVMVCMSKAQLKQSGQQCLCQRVRDRITMKAEIKDIQIYPATVFCNKVEIVVTLNNSFRYCLNPKMTAVKKILTNVIQKQKTTAATVNPTKVNPTTADN